MRDFGISWSYSFRITSLSFHLAAISGPCHFDMGDRVPLYWIWDFTHPEGYPTIAAIANTEGGKHVGII